MDWGIAANIVSATVALLALYFSTSTLVQQNRIQRQANFVPALVGLLDAFRTQQFHEDYGYLVDRLRLENDPSRGVSGLCPRARSAFFNVIYLYQQFAMLVSLGILEYDAVAAVAGRRCVELWSLVEPYVRAERDSGRMSGSGFQLLEEFATLVQRAPATPTHLRLRLAIHRRALARHRLRVRTHESRRS